MNKFNTTNTILEIVGKVLGIVGTVFGIAATIYIYLYPSIEPKYANSLDGYWYADWSYSHDSGKVRYSGTTEYLPNNLYNYIGNAFITGTFENKSVEILYKINATGKWHLEDNEIIKTNHDIKSNIISLALNSKAIDNPKVLNVLQNQEKIKLKYYIPIKYSERFKILSMSVDKMVLSTHDLIGHEIKITSIKQNKPFF